MGDIQTTSGAKFYIGGSSVTEDEANTLPEFEAISAWTEVALIEDLGELGDESTEVTGAAIGDGRIRKAKGARNAGTMAIIAFRDPLDAGQLALMAAEGTAFNFPFKLELPDAPSESYSNSLLYFRGLVMSRRERYGTNDNIMRRVFNVGVNSEVFENPTSTA